MYLTCRVNATPVEIVWKTPVSGSSNNVTTSKAMDFGRRHRFLPQVTEVDALEYLPGGNATSHATQRNTNT